MTSGPTQEEDDEDSIYSSESIRSPHPVHPPETMLDPTLPQTMLLDKSLDEDDMQYFRENIQDSEEGSKFGSVTVLSSDEETGPHTNHVQKNTDPGIPSPPRYPSASDFVDDEGIDPGVHNSEDSLAHQLQNRLDIESGSQEPQPPCKTVSLRQIDEKDDLFDSDEERIDVESLESSSESSRSADGQVDLRQRESRLPACKMDGAMSENVNVETTTLPTSRSEKQSATNSGGGAYSLLTRASQTFYRAFKKSSKKTAPVALLNGSSGHNRSKEAREECLRANDVESLRHERIIQLLEAQIATLNGARTGFVDLRLLKPMTEKTIEAIEKDGKLLLEDYSDMEKRCRELKQKRVEAEEEGEAELTVKEKMLINAKMRLAEAHAEVDGLRHELRIVQRSLETPERRKAWKREERNKRKEGADEDVVAMRKQRKAAVAQAGEQKSLLQAETTELERLEKRYRDIEGDWA